jgi:hypothetical protein
VTDTSSSERVQDIREVRSWLKKDLRMALEEHPKVCVEHLKERDYQAIIKEVLEAHIDPAYKVRLDYRVDGTDEFADLLIVNTADRRCGLRPRAGINGFAGMGFVGRRSGV